MCHRLTISISDLKAVLLFTKFDIESHLIGKSVLLNFSGSLLLGGLEAIMHFYIDTFCCREVGPVYFCWSNALEFSDREGAGSIPPIIFHINTVHIQIVICILSTNVALFVTDHAILIV